MAVHSFSFSHADVVLRMEDGVIVCDPQQLVQFVSPQAAAHLGIDGSALIGRSIGEVFAERRFPLPANGARIAVGNSLAISARPLPGSVGQYQREGTLYLISNRPAEGAEQRDFMAALAHELRARLTIIRGMSELLLRGLAGPIQGEQQEFLGTIKARAIDLSSLVNDLIALANLESGSVREAPSWVDLHERLDTSLNYLVSSRGLPQHRPRYTIAPEAAQLLIDPDVLRHILEGLLNHALVVTPPQGTISVRAARAGQFVELDVSDSGLPVPAYQRRRIFERWAYVPRSPQGASRGTGLEIALTRMFVARCGGSLSYEPGESWGNRWLVRLPQPVRR